MMHIVQPGRNAWAQGTTDASGLLVDAADYYRAFFEAAGRARRHILISGWQFDSGVPLLRGPDAAGRGEVRFLKYLDGLCERTPDLHVYIIAWDFHLVFAGEREWMQRVYFHWMTHRRFQFRFDDSPPPGGSHHQKFVVIDGRLAFLGGIDLCESRWDDRRHLAVNPLRVSHGRLNRGRPAKPYHDVQAYLVGGDAASTLTELFIDRWSRTGGDPPSLGAPDAGAPEPEPPRGAIAFGPTRLALSRTDSVDGQTIREVERLFLDAIAAAERLIYVETQYFSSRRIREALIARMREAERPRLEIVVVVNERAEAPKEEVAVGLRQAENLEMLRRVAAETGHALGLYFSLCDGANDTFRTTYIHSKLMIVDDRFLTVGSANFTNRSLGVDSELHASWEVFADAASQRGLARAISRVRVSLLAEHGGLSGARDVRALRRIDGLVERLDAFASRPGARLQRHGPPTPAQRAAMEVVDPESLPFDPETSEDDDRSSEDEPSDEGRPSRLGKLGRLVGR